MHLDPSKITAEFSFSSTLGDTVSPSITITPTAGNHLGGEGVILSVPCDPNNEHYAEILRLEAEEGFVITKRPEDSALTPIRGAVKTKQAKP